MAYKNNLLEYYGGGSVPYRQGYKEGGEIPRFESKKAFADYYKNEKELGGKSKKVKSPSFGTRIFYKFEMQNIRGFHQIWVYLKNNWELNQV